MEKENTLVVPKVSEKRLFIWGERFSNVAMINRSGKLLLIKILS